MQFETGVDGASSEFGDVVLVAATDAYGLNEQVAEVTRMLYRFMQSLRLMADG